MARSCSIAHAGSSQSGAGEHASGIKQAGRSNDPLALSLPGKSSQEDGDICKRLNEAGDEVWQVDGPDGVSYETNTLELMAKKAIRNRGWSLSKEAYPGRDLRTFDARGALKDQNAFLVSGLIRNLGKGRIRLALASVAIWLRARKLILEADRQPPGR